MTEGVLKGGGEAAIAGAPCMARGSGGAAVARDGCAVHAQPDHVGRFTITKDVVSVGGGEIGG